MWAKKQVKIKKDGKKACHLSHNMFKYKLSKIYRK